MEARRRGRTRRVRLRAPPAEAGRLLQSAPRPLPLVRLDPSPQRASGCLNFSGLCSQGRSVFATNRLGTGRERASSGPSLRGCQLPPYPHPAGAEDPPAARGANIQEHGDTRGAQMDRCTRMHRCAQRCGGLSERHGEKQTRAQNQLKWGGRSQARPPGGKRSLAGAVDEPAGSCPRSPGDSLSASWGSTTTKRP